jgi:hypothetical protein
MRAYFTLDYFSAEFLLLQKKLMVIELFQGRYTETFAQITSDLKLAIETLPATPFTSTPTSRYGHANKWLPAIIWLVSICFILVT